MLPGPIRDYKDREKKGHFRAPCAGSAFKNNHAFGETTGKIIDRLGLRGYQIGGAQIAEYHANIIINKGNATAEEIKKLIYFVKGKVQEHENISLEPEILFVGEW